MYFANRHQAGSLLASALAGQVHERPIVLGIPRGGLPVAAEVAGVLGADLGVVVARKLRAPGQPELAIGAVAADGSWHVDRDVAGLVGADDRYLAAERARQAEEARRREERFDGRRVPPLAGRTVIVVDDGIATGATAIAAVRSVKARDASRVILAVPVGAPPSLDRLRAEDVEVVCLSEEPDMMAVGQFYADFRPVDDDEVAAILDAYRRAHGASVEGARADPAGLRVSDVMTSSVATTSPDDTVLTAARRMADEELGLLVVCRGDEPIGVLTDRDIAVRVAARNRHPQSTWVRDVMTGDVVSCEGDLSVHDAAERMREHGVRRLVVLDGNGRMIGVVSLDDLLALPAPMRPIEPPHAPGP